MKIIVDAFGGDNAPLEILKGCRDAVNEYGYEIILTGNKNIIEKVASENDVSLEKMEIIHCEDVISMHDDPKTILKEHKESSLAVAFKALAEGKGDAVVSAGSTGAVLMGATFIVKRIHGIKRCALAPILPAKNGNMMLIDCGANVECRPEMLVQFAQMGSLYMKKVMGVKNPRVGLANIGVEETKGTQLQVDTYKLLSDDENINFTGNIEVRDVPGGDIDVVVADGFTGNILLKTMEGTVSFFMQNLKEIFKSSFMNKIAAAIILKDLKKLKKSMSTEEAGGAPLLGCAKPVFKAHGNSKAFAFKNAIRKAGIYASENITGELVEEIKKQDSSNKE